MFNPPIFINNRNRFTSVRRMVEHLRRLNDNCRITIIDNGSTYEPLLSWYEQIRGEVDVLLGTNQGHLAFWALGLDRKIQDEWFVYTDPDLELNEDMPECWAEMLKFWANWAKLPKACLALRIDDIPEHYPLKAQVLATEKKWWFREVVPGSQVYYGDTDTTFHLQHRTSAFWYTSVRLAGQYTCRHLPWYLDPSNVDFEERFYTENFDFFFQSQYTKQHRNLLCRTQPKLPQDF